MSNTAPAKQVRKPKKLPFVIMCILSAIVAVLNVLLCVLVPKYYTTINSFLYKGPDADKVAAFRQASADMTQKVESEGIVMLENKNQTLPLASGSKINLFGYGSRDTVYGGSGSGSGDSSNNITLEQGLTNAGFSVNPELVSFYNDHFVERTGVGFTGNNFDINEPAVNEYSDEMIAKVTPSCGARRGLIFQTAILNTPEAQSVSTTAATPREELTRYPLSTWA